MDNQLKKIIKNIFLIIFLGFIGGLLGISIVLIPRLEQAALLIILSFPFGVIIGIVMGLGLILQKKTFFNIYTITGGFLGKTIVLWLTVYNPYWFDFFNIMPNGLKRFLYFFPISYLINNLIFIGVFFYLGYRIKKITKK